MASISNSSFLWHGSGSGYGVENAPKIYLRYTITSGSISGEGSSRTVSLKYDVALNALPQPGLSSKFGYPVRVFTSPPSSTNPYPSDHILYKPATDSRWGDNEYSGSKTITVGIGDVGSDGKYNVSLAIATYQSVTTSSDGCGCGESAAKGQTPFNLGKIQLFTAGAPSAPTCSVNKTEILVGGSFTCSYSGNQCQYRTRNASGTWGSWTTWTGSSGSTFTPASDYSVSAVQMRSRTVDQSYMTPESDYTTSDTVYLKLPTPAAPTVSPNPVTYGSSVTASSAAPSGSGAAVNYTWYSSSGSQAGTGSSYSPGSSGYYCKAHVTKSNFIASDLSSSSSSVEVKCPTPSGLSYSPNPVILGSSATLSYTAVSGCTAEVQVSSNGGSSYSSGTTSLQIQSNQYTFRVRFTRTGCTSSSWTTLGSNITTKLPKPVCSIDSDVVIVGEYVTLAWSSSPSVSGATPQYQYRTSTTGSGTNCSSPFLLSTNSCQFRVQISKSGYTSSEWSDWTSVVSGQIPQPVCTFSPSTVTYGGTVTLSYTSGVSSVTPHYQYWNGSNWIDLSSNQFNNVTSTGTKFRVKVSKSGYVDSVWSAETAVLSVKLPKPSCSFSPTTVVYGSPVTVSSTSSAPSVTSHYQYWNGSSWTNMSSSTLSNVTATNIKFRVYSTKTGYVDSDWSSETTTVSVKLPTPVCSISSSIVVVGENITLSWSSSPNVSGSVPQYQYRTSTSGSGINLSSNTYLLETNTCQFRVQISRTGYVTSEWSEWTSAVSGQIPQPTCSFSPSVVTYGGTVTLNYTSAVSSVTPQYQYWNGSQWVSLSSNQLNNVTATNIKFRVKVTRSGYLDSVWSPETSVVSVKLPTPSCSFSPATAIYGSTVTVSYTSSASSVTPHYQYWNGSSWTDMSSSTLSNVTATNIKFRVYTSRSGYVDSDWSTGTTTVGVKLPTPICSISSSVVVVGENITLSWSSSPTVPGATAQYQYRTSSTGSGTNLSSNTYLLNSNSCQFRVQISKSGYVSSDWSDWTSAVSGQIPRPTCSFSPSVVTYGGNVTLNYTSGISSVTPHYQYWNGTSWIDLSTDSFNNATALGVKFRVKVTRSGYVDSDWSVETSVLVVKLPTPACSFSPSIVMYGGQVTLSSSVSPNVPSSQVQFQYSLNNGTSTNCTSPYTVTSYGYRFRVKVVKSGYTDSEWSSWTSVLPVKLNAPSSLSLMQEPLYNMSLSTFTKSAVAPSTNPSSPSLEWQFSTSGGSSATWYDWNNSHKVTSEYVYVRARYTKTNYTQSDWTSGVSGRTKLSGSLVVTVGQPHYNDLLSSLSKSLTASNDYTGFTEEWQYRTSSSSSWLTWNSSHRITSSYVYLRARYTHTSFTSSDWAEGTSGNTILNQPSSVTVGQSLYNGLLSSLSKSAASATNGNPAGVSVVWTYRTSTSGSWSAWNSNHRITTPYIYLRAYYSLSGYANSSTTEGTSGNTKLNPPSSVTVGQPLYNSLLSSLSKTASSATNGNPAGVSVTWEYRTSTSGSWTSWNPSHRVTSSYIYLRACNTLSEYVVSDTVEGTSGNTKLNKPSAPSVSPSPVTVESAVTASGSVDSEATAVYTWYRSNGVQISGQISSTYTTNYQDGSGIYAKLQASRSGYESSDLSDKSSSVTVYFEPRSMTANNGFSVIFNPSTSGQTVIPSTQKDPSFVTAAWSGFAPSKNLGRFDYFVLELLVKNDNGSWSIDSSATKRGDNDPSRSRISTPEQIEVSTNWAGKTCKLRLSCYYRDPAGGLYGPDNSAVFESQEFLVAGYPSHPDFLYPSTETFTTCNSLPRIFFRVNSPEYLTNRDIVDVEIKIRTSPSAAPLGTYTYKNNPGMFRVVKKNGGVVSSGSIPSESVVVFIPTISTFNFTSHGQTRYIYVKCTNSYDLDVSFSFTCTYDSFPYVEKGEILSETDHRYRLHQRVFSTLEDYSNVNGRSWSLTAPSTSENSEVAKSFFSVMVTDLRRTFDLVSVYTSASGINLGNIDVDTENYEVVAEKERFGEVRGNYFNDVLYVLKNML